MNALRGTAALIAALSLAQTHAGAAPKPITAATTAAVKAWVHAVRTHVPGTPDDAVVSVAALTYEAREELNTGMDLFLRALVAKNSRTDNNPAAKAIVDLGHAAGQPGANGFLKRAAVLHADVAIYGDRNPTSASGDARSRESQRRTEKLPFGGGMGSTTIEREEAPPPLLTRSRLILHHDGQVLGEVIASWNWPFARSLLDLVDAGRATTIVSDGRAAPASDPFVAAWYHAAAAYMFEGGSFGDLTPHLQHAADVLPNAAPLVFDRGCYAEILGLPMHQALLPERVAGPRGSDHGDFPTWTTPTSAPPLRVPPAERTNAEAERLFRRALALDPSLAEARVRMARLLISRKQYKEAAAELDGALTPRAEDIVTFYARLFAGRAAQSMARLDEAARHYREALALFPDAQSALLASSQLALLQADVSGALAPVQRLGGRSAVFTSDPWWQYSLCAGRDASDLMKALWKVID